jgi:hypothetical protein
VRRTGGGRMGPDPLRIPSLTVDGADPGICPEIDACAEHPVVVIVITPNMRQTISISFVFMVVACVLFTPAHTFSTVSVPGGEPGVHAPGAPTDGHRHSDLEVSEDFFLPDVSVAPGGVDLARGAVPFDAGSFFVVPSRFSCVLRL